jgi:hypothetical protein
MCRVVLQLNASVLMKDPVSVTVHATTKAKLQLEKALSLDSLHLPAVYLLVEIYEQEVRRVICEPVDI